MCFDGIIFVAEVAWEITSDYTELSRPKEKLVSRDRNQIVTTQQEKVKTFRGDGVCVVRTHTSDLVLDYLI